MGDITGVILGLVLIGFSVTMLALSLPSADNALDTGTGSALENSSDTIKGVASTSADLVSLFPFMMLLGGIAILVKSVGG